MSTLAVAKKDFGDGIRSRVLLGLVALFAVFVAGAAYFFTEISPPMEAAPGGNPDAAAVIISLLVPTYILLPVIGTMVGYKAISGERESGSLKFLLGLPHTRRDVVFGKLLGRSGLVAVAVVAGFAVGGVALYALTDAFPLGDYAALTGTAVLLGATFVSIAIAFSSAARSSTVATGGAITLVLLFLFLWQVLLTLVRFAAEELSLIEASASQPPEWFLFFQNLNPTIAFQSAAAALIDTEGGGPPSVLSDPPFYLEEWFGFVILGFWLVVPIGLAFLRFRGTDL
jgi:ABC-2 type transport system permease protein